MIYSLFINRGKFPSDFREEDYKPNEYEGRVLMSLSEKAYYSYIKTLINKKDKELINSFLPHLDDIISKHLKYNSLHISKVNC